MQGAMTVGRHFNKIFEPLQYDEVRQHVARIMQTYLSGHKKVRGDQQEVTISIISNTFRIHLGKATIVIHIKDVLARSYL